METETHNPDNWEAGWDLMTQMLSEDEEWARIQFEAFHGREY
jgi:hypothetical protein